MPLPIQIVHEWNGHLEIFSCPQVTENSGQYLLLQTDILQKTVVGYPCLIFPKRAWLHFLNVRGFSPGFHRLR